MLTIWMRNIVCNDLIIILRCALLIIIFKYAPLFIWQLTMNSVTVIIKAKLKYQNSIFRRYTIYIIDKRCPIYELFKNELLANYFRAYLKNTSQGLDLCVYNGFILVVLEFINPIIVIFTPYVITLYHFMRYVYIII